MKFVKTYMETSFDTFYKAYYYINNKRVTEEKFYYMDTLCSIKGLKYNCSSLTKTKNNRIKAVYYYD